MSFSSLIVKSVTILCLLSFCCSTILLKNDSPHTPNGNSDLISDRNLATSVCGTKQFLIKDIKNSINVQCVPYSSLNCAEATDFIGCTKCPNGFFIRKGATLKLSVIFGTDIEAKIDACQSLTIVYILVGIGIVVLASISLCVWCCVKSARNKKALIESQNYNQGQSSYASIV